MTTLGLFLAKKRPTCFQIHLLHPQLHNSIRVSRGRLKKEKNRGIFFLLKMKKFFLPFPQLFEKMFQMFLQFQMQNQSPAQSQMSIKLLSIAGELDPWRVSVNEQI